MGIILILVLVGQSSTRSLGNVSTSNKAQLHGTIRDSHGAVIWNALLRISRDKSSSQSNCEEDPSITLPGEIQSNQFGRFSVELRAGCYKVCVSKQEFLEKCTNIRLATGADVAIDFALAADPAYEKAYEPAPIQLMWDRLRQLAGEGAINCGHVPVEDDPKKETSCALRAFKHGKSFLVSYAEKGVDAELSDGIAMDPSGNAYGVIFDSIGLQSDRLPKAATMPDGDHTVVLACPKPLKFKVNKKGRITCFSKSQPFFWTD